MHCLCETATVPTYGSEEAAGLDLYASEDFEIGGHDQRLISTGIAMEIPKGFFGQIKARSGLSARHQIDVRAGVIDSDYRGEIKVILRNESNRVFVGKTGDRIAQMIVQPCARVRLVKQNDLAQSKRGGNGFGSTGK